MTLTQRVAKAVVFGQQSRVYCQACRLYCRKIDAEHHRCSRCATDYHLDEASGEWRAAS